MVMEFDPFNIFRPKNPGAEIISHKKKTSGDEISDAILTEDGSAFISTEDGLKYISIEH
jgi:hypothetical protein